MLKATTNDDNTVQFKPNTIYCGDCKEVMRYFPENSIDLIYLDPPFFSNRHYEVIWNDGYELRAFEDRWKGGIMNYVGWMVERLRECHRVLKPTGSMYVHCDWHASHYLRVELDKIFGSENCFINEVIWKRQVAHSDTKQGSQHYGRLHDTILFYVKDPKKYTWNPQYTEYDKEYIENSYKNIEPGTGRRYMLDNLVAPGGGSKAKGNPKYEFLGVTRYWRYSKENMQKLYKEGKIIQTKAGNVPRYKRYLDEMPGVMLQDVWNDVKPVSSSDENLGYPTQKPQKLLERIVIGSSNPNDIVLDPFCGCGTTIAAAHSLGSLDPTKRRRWIGIEISPTACKLMAKRMRSLYAKDVEVIGMPKNVGELQKLLPFEFQNWVVEKLHGRINPRKVGDMGIDGWVDLNVPLQVKQQDGVGRVTVDNFETAIKRYYGSDFKDVMKGVIVAFSFTKDAHEEVERVKIHDKVEITLMTVEELLNMS